MRSSARTRRQSTPITLDNEPPPPCLAFARPLRRQRATVGRRWRRVSTTSTPARADWHRSLPSRRAAVTEHRSTLDERGRRRSYRRIRSNERRTRRYLAKECRRVTDSAMRKTTNESDVVSCERARSKRSEQSRMRAAIERRSRRCACVSTLPLARNDVDDARRTTSTQSATRRRPSRTVAVEAAPVAGGGRRRASFAHSVASARCDRRARTTLSSSASSSLDTSALRLRTNDDQVRKTNTWQHKQHFLYQFCAY